MPDITLRHVVYGTLTWAGEPCTLPGVIHDDDLDMDRCTGCNGVLVPTDPEARRRMLAAIDQADADD